MQTANGNAENSRESGMQNDSVNYLQNGDSAKAAKFMKTKSLIEITLTGANTVKSFGRNERRVLVIYTGGTIGMVKNVDGVLIPQKGAFENILREYPQLHDSAYWKQRLREADFDTTFLVLPEAKDLNVRILYKIYEYENLLDSSNMSEKEWIKIAEDIMKYYDVYDGFVVLHGTDTLSYTASALSFMFENIGKAVVLTGSQIPIFEPRSDGADNFVSSLLIAGGLNIPEVTLFFGSKLFRGNRTRKISANNLFAFDSPNSVPLVEVGIDMEVNKRAIFKPTVIEKCHLHAKMSKNVGLLRIFPSISSSVIKAFCKPPVEGVVLESYGAGNIPSNRPDVLDEIIAAIKRGVIIVNITQCTTGAVVIPLYETGQFLSKIGVVSGFDMTPEAALTKLSYVLTKTELTYQQKVEMMSRNIRGELTDTLSIPSDDNTLISALASSLNIQSPKKLSEISDKVFHALLLYAIEHDDERAVTKTLDMGADVNAQNSEGKTPLHEAIVKGNPSIVAYLLTKGANVHLKTRCGESPFLTAIHSDNPTMIELLTKCGAHPTSIDNKTLAELLSLAARSGKISKMESLRYAGVDLNIPDELMQTPLHKAVLCNHPDLVKYLIQHGVKIEEKDIIGCTPRDYAEKLKRHNMLSLFGN